MNYKYLLTLNELSELSGKTMNELRAFFSASELHEINRQRTGVLPEAVKRFMSKKRLQYTFRAIAHINLRGGIGKTSSAVTLATRAAQYGFKTCILDLDPQASASFTFEAVDEHQPDIIFYDGWQKPKEMLLPALKEIQPGLSILPSALENAMLDSSLMNPTNLKKAVKNTVETLKNDGYDLVVIDCSPSLGAGTISAICGSSDVVIPVWGDYFSMKGLELTMQEINSITETFSIDKPDIHILFTKFDKREKMNTSSMQRLKENYPNNLLSTYIRVSSDISKAFETHQTIFANHQKSVAKEDYDAYVQKLLKIPKTRTKKH